MIIGLRTRLLLPLAAGIVLCAAYTVAMSVNASASSRGLLLLLVVCFAIVAADVELVVIRPLRGLLAAWHELRPERFGPDVGETSTRSLRALTAAVGRLGTRMEAYESALAEEQRLRHELEQNVRELRERYSLTVERANDGIWEWNLKEDRVDFSPRWKALVGQLQATLDNIDQWRSLLHPEESAAVMLRLEDHINGRTPHFDEEYRIRHDDGQYRWVHSRGTAIRHASGKAYRMIVMDNDVHERKQIEQALVAAAEALSSVSGDDFYRALMETLSSILGTRDNLVCYCVGDPPSKAQTLAYYSKGKFWDNFEYDLAGTSCGAVIDRGEIVYAPSGVCDIWPLEKEYDRDSYLGVPMFDSSGNIIGHFACMDGKPMRQDLPHLALFRIFSVRAAAELERMLLRRKLEAARPAA